MSISNMGRYVDVDWSSETEEIIPLAEALSYAILPNRPVSFFLEGIFTGNGPSGGDPGWAIDRKKDKAGQLGYWVYMDRDISGQDIEEAWYDEPTVKRHVRRTLENFATAHPDRKDEVNEALLRYSL